MRIRLAKESDRETFLSLWRNMLEENHKIGGEYLPTERNLAYYANFFDKYVGGEADGVALVAEDDSGPFAALLWGDVGQAPIDTIWGRIAVGHGTYVSPDMRRGNWATALRSVARPILRSKGFDSVVGTAVQANEAGIRSGLDKGGFRLHGILGYINLGETE